jgi:hypothetical protein
MSLSDQARNTSVTAAPPPGPAGRATPQLSRRSMLRGAAGAGAAGLAVSALAGTALAGPALAATGPKAQRDAADAGPHAVPLDTEQLPAAEPLVVHVRDVRTGEMDVFRGTSHVRVRDRGLAADLARAAG